MSSDNLNLEGRLVFYAKGDANRPISRIRGTCDSVNGVDRLEMLLEQAGHGHYSLNLLPYCTKKEPKAGNKVNATIKEESTLEFRSLAPCRSISIYVANSTRQLTHTIRVEVLVFLCY
jgi:hypothetical protein